MIFQWYVFAILLFAFFVGKIADFNTEVECAGTLQIKYKWVPVFVLVIPLIFIAGFRGSMNGFGDSSAYISSYLHIPENYPSIHDIIIESDIKDKGFEIFAFICRHIIGDNYNWYLSLIAALCLFLVFRTFKNYSISFFLSSFLFLASGDYIQWCHNGIRQFLAVAIVFGSTELLLKKKYIPYILVILLASTIHFSALIMIPMIFIVQGKAWNKRTVVFIIMVLAILLFIDRFTDFFSSFMENTQYRNEINQFEESKGTNILRVSVFSVPSIISLIYVNKIRELDNSLINLCVGMSIVTIGLYMVSALTSGLFVGRLTIYFSLFNYILLPWELKYLFSEKLSKQLTFFAIILYIIFYCYQVQYTWQL